MTWGIRSWISTTTGALWAPAFGPGHMFCQSWLTMGLPWRVGYSSYSSLIFFGFLLGLGLLRSFSVSDFRWFWAENHQNFIMEKLQGVFPFYSQTVGIQTRRPRDSANSVMFLFTKGTSFNPQKNGDMCLVLSQNWGTPKPSKTNDFPVGDMRMGQTYKYYLGEYTSINQLFFWVSEFQGFDS